MSEWLALLHVCLRWSHIVTGFAGLALFWLVVACKKGTPSHRRLGKLFVLTAFYVGGAAVLSSAWALVYRESKA